MKIILVVCVIFVKYLQFNNVAGELLSQYTLGTLSECQGENCLAHNTSLNRRSLDPVVDSFTLEKLTNRRLRHTKHSKTKKKKKIQHHPGKKNGEKSMKFTAELLLSKIEKQIHQSAVRKISKTKKLSKSNKKSLKRLIEKSHFAVSSLMKMSKNEFFMHYTNFKTAENISISSSEEIMGFVNASVDKLRDEIYHAGQDIKELADNYWKKMVASGKEDFIAIGNHASPEDKKKKREETENFFKKVAQCSGERLMDVYRNWESELTSMATSSGNAVKDLHSKNCNRFKKIASNETKLQLYITFSCNRMAQLTQHSSDKFYEIAKSCLQFLLEVVENSRKSVKALAEYLIQIANAIADNDEDKKTKLEKNVNDLYDKMDHSNQQLYDDMAKNTTRGTGEIYNFHDSIVKGFKGCDVKNASSCPT